MIKADLHIHVGSPQSRFKETNINSNKIENILKIAKKKGLDAISITDHNLIRRSLLANKIAKKYGLLAIPGTEISSKQGHILGYGITEKISKKSKSKPNMFTVIEKIHDLGGLAVCAHPTLPWFGVGKKNIKCFDGVEIYNGRQHTLLNPKLVHFNQFVTGGSDAHTLNEIGNVITIFKEPFETVDEFLTLLRKRKTLVKKIKRSKFFKEQVFPDVKSTFEYGYELIKSRT